MKKMIALILAMAVVLCSAALADLAINPGTADGSVIPYYKGDYVPNGDGTHHSADGRCTAPCAVESVTLGDNTYAVCVVCGDFYINNEQQAKIELADKKDYQMDCVRLRGTGKMVNGCSEYYAMISENTIAADFQCAPMTWLTNGQYMVRVLELNNEDAKYLVTVCHEIAGVAYEAEGTFAYMLPVNGIGATVTKAYFGNEMSIKAEVKVQNAGLYFKPYSAENAFGMFIIK